MKNSISCAFLMLFALASFTACNQNGDQHDAQTHDTTITADSMATTTPPADLMSLADLNGQYPADVALLDNPLINSRLKTLLGKDYDAFRKYWNTETPIVVEENVLATSGCEVHNCAANQYLLQIDLKNNNINVYHLGKEIQTYQEKGPIHLPTGLSKEFDTIMGNRPV